MFTNLKAFAGNFIEKLDSKISQLTEDAKPQSKPDWVKEAKHHSGSQTVRPLYEKAKPAKPESAAGGLSLNLSQSMFDFSQTDQPREAGWFSSRSCPKKPPALAYCPTEPPSSQQLWKSDGVEEVLGTRLFRYGYDEAFRQQLEECARKQRQPSPADFTEEDQEALEENLEILQLLKRMIEGAGTQPYTEIDIASLQHMSVFLVNSRTEAFLAHMMREKVEPILEATLGDRGRCLESIQALLDTINKHKLQVDCSIKSIVNKRNCDFWGINRRFVGVCSESEALARSVGGLRSSVCALRRQAVSKNQQLKRLYLKRRQKEELLDALEVFGLKYRGALACCSEEAMACTLEEVPAVYERLVVAAVQVSGETQDRLVGLLARKTFAFVDARLGVLRKRLKSLLYLHLGLFEADQEQPPHQELVRVFMVYTEISQKHRRLASADPRFDMYAADSILLKAHCCDLAHLDDSLTCLEQAIITDFF
jgi:hypothetical protein